MAAKFRALVSAFVFDLAVGHDRRVAPGTIVESDIELDEDVHVLPTGEATSSARTSNFQRLPDDADIVRDQRNCWINRPTYREGEEPDEAQ